MTRKDIVSYHSSPHPTLEDELLQLLSKYGTKVPVPVFLAALLIASISAKSIGVFLCASWMVSVTVILLIRYLVLKSLPEKQEVSSSKRLQTAFRLSLINGLCHGTALLFFPWLNDLERVLLTLVLIGLSTGAIGTTAGHRKIFLAYMLPTAGGVSACWFITAIFSGGEWIASSLFILTGLFCYVLISLANDAYRLFSESFDIRSQQTSLNEDLNIALQEARAANSAKTRFLAAASHDLRQPIHTLSLLGASLSMRSLDDKTRDIANHMNIALQSLATQLDALLDISKLDANIVEVNNSCVNLQAMCKRLYTEFLPSAAEKSLTLTIDCPDDCYVYTDPTLFERVLRNLLSNAIKYTHRGKVALEITKPASGHYEISVLDTGIGMSAEEQSLIFEEFYQIDNPERDRNKGLGLGLAIVKRLISLLDLPLKVRSEKGMGTTMTVSVEVAQNTLEQGISIVSETLPWPNLTILVIDDEEMVRLSMRTLLEELGANVLLASSTAEALSAIKTDPPDIVLADYRLKNNDSGLKAIERIQGLMPKLPAILISGDTAPDRLNEAKRAGVLLLHKPVSINALKQNIMTTIKQYQVDREHGDAREQKQPQL